MGKPKQEKSVIHKISMPKGGGAFQGLGEDLCIQDFTGECLFSLPLFVSPCRQAEPELMLEYCSANGNGVFGFGFSLNPGAVSRQTSKRIPTYSDPEDIFVLNKKKEKELIRIRREENSTADIYAQRYEQDFDFIEHVKTGTESFWRITDRNHCVFLYGQTKNSRITDPDNTEHIFAWLICESVDDKGNKIRYEYNEDHQIKRIWYGNYVTEQGEEKWMFSILFQYEQGREDSFFRFTSGFCREYTALCTEIALMHHIGDIPQKVRSTQFTYECRQGISLLKKISVTGYRTDASGRTDSLSEPDIVLDYTDFCPENGRYHELKIDGELPGVLKGRPYELLDFYGEGIAGLLYVNGDVCAYCRPLGNYRYGAPHIVGGFPDGADRFQAEAAFVSLEGNGRYDYVIKSKDINGFYSLKEGKFDSFCPFPQTAAEQSVKNAEYADLQGDRQSHLLSVHNDQLVYYPALKKQGVGKPVLQHLPEDFPAVTENAADEKVCFLDLFGDGLPHRVKIRNGYAECFPNLGYGKFGEKIVLKNVPFIEGGLDTSRLYFSDINGSGTADFIYVYPDRADIYLNKNGREFMEPFSVPFPKRYARGGSIAFADISGSGCQSMLFTEGGAEGKLYGFDFGCRTKPYMLCRTDCGNGLTSEVEYESSVSMYLKDRAQGRPWKLRTPFPVQVVSCRRKTDAISQCCTEIHYVYHDGLYDYEENAFRGFGFTERFQKGQNIIQKQNQNQKQKENQNTDYNTVKNEKPVTEGNKDAYIAAGVNTGTDLYEKEWFYTGVDYCSGYNQMDTQALELIAYTYERKGTTPENADVKRSMYGKVLRKETYHRPGELPWKVEQTSYRVAETAAPFEGRKGAYFVSSAQTIEYRYGNLQKNLCENQHKNIVENQHENMYEDINKKLDPAVCHQFCLETDAYGNVVRSCKVYYPRRTKVPPKGQESVWEEQKKMTVTELVAKYNNQTQTAGHPGIKTETIQYKVQGLSCEGYFTMETIKDSLAEAGKEILHYGEEFTEGKKQKRIMEWHRYFYWNEAQTEALPLGGVSGRALLHHEEEAVFPAEFPVLAEHLNETQIAACGYKKADGYWWNVSPVTNYYGAECFFLPSCVENRNVFYRTCIRYDSFALMPVAAEEYIDEREKNCTSAQIDYQAMAYAQVTDENENIVQAVYDPLNHMIAVTSFGMTDGVWEGDGNPDTNQKGDLYEQASFSDVLRSPEKYLQNRTCFYCYDLLAYQERGEPAGILTLRREKPLSMEKTGRILCSVSYWDGAGRKLEERRKLEDGRWIVTDKTVYDGFGNPVLKYAAYESGQAGYEKTPEGPDPVRLYYDSMNRVIRTETPDTCSEAEGKDFCQYYFSETEYGVWEQIRRTEDSTLASSQYYIEFQQRYPEVPDTWLSDKKTVLQRVLEGNREADLSAYDSRGNKIADFVHGDGGFVQYWYDAGSRMYAAADARCGSLGRKNLELLTDMSGRELYTKSCDAGIKIQLLNVHGFPVHIFDGNGVHKIISYDGLMRRTQTVTEGTGVTERTVYGEQAKESIQKNLRGQPYLCYSQAGIVQNSCYTYQGYVKEKNRQVFGTESMNTAAKAETGTNADASQKTAADWSVLPCGGLLPDTEIYRESYSYNAAGDACRRLLPNGSVYTYRYDQAGRLEAVFQTAGENSAPVPVLQQALYNAQGNRTKLLYANGVCRTFAYHPANMRLEAVKSVKPDGTILEDNTYYYSPSGKILRIRDNTGHTAVRRQQTTEPVRDYWYDGCDRLKKTAGRESGADPNDFADLVKYSQEYFYDAGGNLTGIRHSSPVKKFTVTMDVETGSNRIRSVKTADASAGSELEYDGCGNMKNLPNLRRMDWNADGHLAHVTVVERADGKNDEEFYAYDADGFRVRKTTRRQLADGRMEQTEKVCLDDYSMQWVSSDKAKTIQIKMTVKIGNACVAQVLQDADGQTSMISQLEDHTGSVGISLDDQAQLICMQEYYPYGGIAIDWNPDRAMHSVNDTIKKEYRYCGRETDRATGLYDFGARYYSPYLGRMISADGTAYIKAEDWQTLNLYVYCRGDPLNYTDPDGHLWGLIAAGAAGAVTIAAGLYRRYRNNHPSDTVLTVMENAGGHTIARHVGKSWYFLWNRSRNPPGPDATSFPNLATATRAYREMENANLGQIQAWLAGRQNRLAVVTNHGRIGYGVAGKEKSNLGLFGMPFHINIQMTTAVLQRNAAMPQGYRLITMYPKYR